MDDPYAALRSRQQHKDGYRTPAIEDENHPLNLWRTRQSNNGRIDSYFPPQDQNTTEQIDRFRKLENQPGRSTEQPRRKSTARDVHLPWKERVKHTTWAYFTMCMATGGLANVLHAGMLPIAR